MPTSYLLLIANYHETGVEGHHTSPIGCHRSRDEFSSANVIRTNRRAGHQQDNPRALFRCAAGPTRSSKQNENLYTGKGIYLLTSLFCSAV